MVFWFRPRAIQVNLRFPGRGIAYDDLSEEEKEEWESTDWGDDEEPIAVPDRRRAHLVFGIERRRGVIEPGALYEAPFTGLYAGGPDGLFAGRSEMITGIFQAIEATQPVFLLVRGRSLGYFLEQFPTVTREQAITVLSLACEKLASTPPLSAA